MRKQTSPLPPLILSLSKGRGGAARLGSLLPSRSGVGTRGLTLLYAALPHPAATKARPSKGANLSLTTPPLKRRGL